MELYNKEFVYFDWDDKLDGKQVMVSDDIYKLKRYVNGEEINTYEVSKSSDDKYPFRISGTAFRFCYYDPHYEFRKAYLEGKQLQFKDSTGNWRDVEGEPIFTRDEYRIKPENTWHVILVAGTLVYSNAETDDKHFYFEGTKEQCDEWINVHEKFELVMLAWEQGKTIQYNSGHGWEDCCDNNPSWEYNVEYRIKDTYVPFDTVDELIKCWEKKFPGNANRPEYTMPLIWIKNKEKNRVYLISDFLFEKCYGDDVGTYESNYKLKDLFNDFTFLDGSIIGKRSK